MLSNINRKTWGLFLLVMIIFALPFLALISSKQTGPTFWNYEQHLDLNQEAIVRNLIGYNTFADLDELEGAIKSNKVSAAISSDYQAAKLATNHQIQKIDFNRLWGISNDYDALKAKLQQIYTPFVFKTLDEAFTLPNNEKLWQYAIPYAAQQKVIAFNILRGNWNQDQKAKLNTVSGLNELFPDKSYFGILKSLHNYGYKKILINDVVRDNMMIGSEYNSGTFNSTPTIENYREQLDNFKKTIEQGFKQSFNSNYVNFNSDGTIVLENLIDPRKDWDTAIMYNGDTLDSYHAQDKFTTLEQDKIVRAIFPENSINLVDVLIIPHYINDNNLLEKVYLAINQGFFKNGDTSNLSDLDIKDPSQDYPIAINFNYLYYSVAYEAYDKLILDKFFIDEDGELDLIAQNIYQINLPSGDWKNHFAQNIDNKLFTSIFYYYMMLKN